MGISKGILSKESSDKIRKNLFYKIYKDIADKTDDCSCEHIEIFTCYTNISPMNCGVHYTYYNNISFFSVLAKKCDALFSGDGLHSGAYKIDGYVSDFMGMPALRFKAEQYSENNICYVPILKCTKQEYVDDFKQAGEWLAKAHSDTDFDLKAVDFTSSEFSDVTLDKLIRQQYNEKTWLTPDLAIVIGLLFVVQEVAIQLIYKENRVALFNDISTGYVEMQSDILGVLTYMSDSVQNSLLGIVSGVSNMYLHGTLHPHEE